MLAYIFPMPGNKCLKLRNLSGTPLLPGAWRTCTVPQMVNVKHELQRKDFTENRELSVISNSLAASNLQRRERGTNGNDVASAPLFRKRRCELTILRRILGRREAPVAKGPRPLQDWYFVRRERHLEVYVRGCSSQAFLAFSRSPSKKNKQCSGRTGRATQTASPSEGGVEMGTTRLARGSSCGTYMRET